MFLKHRKPSYQTNILFALCVVLSISFILPYNITSIIIITSFIYFSLLYRFKNLQTQSPSFVLTILLLIFLILSFINLLRSDHYHDAMLQFQTRVGLLFIPLLIFISPFHLFKRKNYQTLIFILTCVTILYTAFVLIGAWQYVVTHHENGEYGNDTLSQFIKTPKFYKVFRTRIGKNGVHQVYLSSFISWCGINLAYMFSSHKSKSLKVFAIASFIILLVLSAIVASRIPFILFVIISTGILLYRSNWRRRIIILCAFPILLALLFQIPSLKTRTKDLLTMQAGSNRSDILHCSLQQLDDHLIFGKGLRNYEEDLYSCYKDLKSILAYDRKYNTHNQYLDITISMGVVGLFSLIAFLAYSLYRAVKSRNALHAILVSIFIINLLTENMFSRFHGIMLFSLFNAMFFKIEENYQTYKE